MDIAKFVLVGLVSGVFAGFFGVGGGIVLVPALIWIFHVSQHEAQGVSLVALLLPVGFLGAWTYYKAQPFPLAPGFIIAGGMLVGAWIGASFANQVSDRSLRISFGILTVFAGLKLILGK